MYRKTPSKTHICPICGLKGCVMDSVTREGMRNSTCAYYPNDFISRFFIQLLSQRNDFCPYILRTFWLYTLLVVCGTVYMLNNRKDSSEELRDVVSEYRMVYGVYRDVYASHLSLAIDLSRKGLIQTLFYIQVLAPCLERSKGKSDLPDTVPSLIDQHPD